MTWPPTFSDVPVLETPRLRMRRFRMSDVGTVFNLVSDLSVAKWTARIPHPYERKMAEEWLRDNERLRDQGRSLLFAVTVRGDDSLIGAVSLEIEDDPGHAEIGYYLGRDYWGCGYMTEAARAALDFGFEALGVDVVRANVFEANEASAGVLRKLGFVDLGPSTMDAPARGGIVPVLAYSIDRAVWASLKGEA
ncbi:N-acetyltransferase [Hwanghaeella grinnelliae]|uniref:N-acetyltransferase n=1 Tax=Hwanghaeella grinnelliae TaxID=2500179 RepID=A0A3S2W8L3_9PROT|nr:GNAT family N-acetyltransferase [Hwanghaeella grinnelliae]RVU35871.1 N-acetyltransferase [Hwanghaeella grinnelliae]